MEELHPGLPSGLVAALQRAVQVAPREFSVRALEEAGVPGLLIEADMADPRAYAEERVRTRVQAFLEALQSR